MPWGHDDATDIRQLLSRRADALGVLVEGSYDKSELTDELDVSRSTVDRTIRRFETNGLVRREGGQTEATLAGRLAFDSYRRFCERTTDVAEFGDLLRELPSDVEIDHDLLDGATAYRSEPPATGRPANEVTALIAAGTRLRACATVINDSAASAELHRMITERGGSASVVYSGSLADHIRDLYYESHHEMAATGRYRAYEIADLPYELFIVDTDDGTRVAAIVYSETGRLKGAIVNDTDAAVAWAEATFERYRDRATEFTDDFLVGDRTRPVDSAATETDGEP
jgi:predicted transcriptional regulator